MADQVNNSGGTPKHSRFRKSTVPLAKDHLRRGNTESALFGVNVISRANEMSGSGNLGSGKVEPVLPMFVQMNVRWDSVDQSWREASRYLHVEYRMVLTFIYKVKGKPFWFHQTVLINMFYRWVRFEEDIEENGKRWSKPHVPALPLASFIEFRQCFAEGMVALDVPGNSLEDIIGTFNFC